MKKIRATGLLLVLLMMILSVPKIYAQADVVTNYNVEINIVKKDSLGNVVKTYVSVNDAVEKMVFSSQGNFLRIVTIKLDRTHDFLKYSMPYAIVGISLSVDLDDDGFQETELKDKRAVITKSGILKLVYHINNGHS